MRLEEVRSAVHSEGGVSACTTAAAVNGQGIKRETVSQTAVKCTGEPLGSVRWRNGFWLRSPFSGAEFLRVPVLSFVVTGDTYKRDMTRNTVLLKRQRSRTGLVVLCCLCLLLCASGQNVQRERITFGDTSDKAACRIEMEGLSGRGRRSAILRAFVECNDERIYDEELAVGDIEEIELEHVRCCARGGRERDDMEWHVGHKTIL